MNFSKNTPIHLTNVISPKEESIAYETLWAMDNMTEKKISELFEKNQTPSQTLSCFSNFKKNELKEKVSKYLNKIEGSFSVSLHGDFQYPEKLRQAQYPIELFYYKGNIELVNTRCISVVGARKCSPEGLMRTERMTKLLVQNNFTIVSGLAEGVDTIALKTAIAEKGNVIAVIGTPINQYYPKQNQSLQDQIAKEHLLISQVPFYRYEQDPFPTRKYNFPRRNATMSAISEATVIIEASDTSGTLTQARAALFQKRKLFILNSCFENKNITWPTKYEKKGAIRVNDISDILNNLEG